MVDGLHGPVVGVVDDLVLRRSDGVPAYNLAVVVDDAAQGVEEVVRADDLLPSTPRQAHLASLLGLPVPAYLHVPLVVGADGDRLAKRHGLTLHERPWMASAVMIARKFDAPVIPLRIRARNSALFYLLDAVHPTLRDVTLFNEVLNKAGHTYRITVGKPIDPASLPAKSEEGIEALRRAVLDLPAPGPNAAHMSHLREVRRRRAQIRQPMGEKL